MKLSVLMSVYKNDNPEYLNLALASIYDNQTRKPDEIIVVFDGPLTEALYSVLDKFRLHKEDVVFYYPQEENKGLGEALKIGVQYCTGDYIFRMDSDDISHPCRFEKQLAYVEAYPEIDVVGSDVSEFYQSPKEENQRVRACPSEHHDIVTMGKKRNPLNHVSACIKRDALLRCGGYEPLLLLEDYYLWLRMIQSGCLLGNINESLVYVRIGNGFHSRRGSKIRIKGWKFLQRYMVKNRMINRVEAFMNMQYIRLFTYCPASLRKFAYDRFLRK